MCRQVLHISWGKAPQKYTTMFFCLPSHTDVRNGLVSQFYFPNGFPFNKRETRHQLTPYRFPIIFNDVFRLREYIQNFDSYMLTPSTWSLTLCWPCPRGVSLCVAKLMELWESPSTKSSRKDLIFSTSFRIKLKLPKSDILWHMQIWYMQKILFRKHHAPVTTFLSVTPMMCTLYILVTWCFLAITLCNVTLCSCVS